MDPHVKRSQLLNFTILSSQALQSLASKLGFRQNNLNAVVLLYVHFVV